MRFWSSCFLILWLAPGSVTVAAEGSHSRNNPEPQSNAGQVAYWKQQAMHLKAEVSSLEVDKDGLVLAMQRLLREGPAKVQRRKVDELRLAKLAVEERAAKKAAALADETRQFNLILNSNKDLHARLHPLQQLAAKQASELGDLRANKSSLLRTVQLMMTINKTEARNVHRKQVEDVVQAELVLKSRFLTKQRTLEAEAEEAREVAENKMEAMQFMKDQNKQLQEAADHLRHTNDELISEETVLTSQLQEASVTAESRAHEIEVLKARLANFSVVAQRWTALEPQAASVEVKVRKAAEQILAQKEAMQLLQAENAHLRADKKKLRIRNVALQQHNEVLERLGATVGVKRIEAAEKAGKAAAVFKLARADAEFLRLRAELKGRLERQTEARET